MKCVWILIGIFLCGFTEIENQGQKPPSVLYLTWMHDPTTTMTVHWQSQHPHSASAVYYRKCGDEQWILKTGIYASLPKTRWLVHTVELDSLDPATEYQFRLLGREGVFRFRTLQKTLSSPMKFAVGGDAYRYLSTFRTMNKSVAACDPDFVVVGGDIAYVYGRAALFKGKQWEIKRWRSFLQEWTAEMVTSDGRMIPIVPVVGNHDVRSCSLKLASDHFLFHELFAFEKRGVPYRVFDAGNYLSLLLLDSGHQYPIRGQQTDWLQEVLAHRESIPHKMAVYHISAYPSVYPYSDETSELIREEWCPLFEQYRLQVAFEHHNHAYKRTFPLKGGEIDPNGVIYMGDGSWGVSPRKPKSLWYLEKIERSNAVCLVTLTEDKSRVEAINLRGKVIDCVETFPRMP